MKAEWCPLHVCDLDLNCAKQIREKALVPCVTCRKILLPIYLYTPIVYEKSSCFSTASRTAENEIQGGGYLLEDSPFGVTFEA